MIKKIFILFAVFVVAIYAKYTIEDILDSKKELE